MSDASILSKGSMKATPPTIKRTSPEGSPKVIPKVITPMTPPKITISVQSPKTEKSQKRNLMVCSQASQDSMGSMAPRLSIISEKNVEGSLSDNDD